MCDDGDRTRAGFGRKDLMLDSNNPDHGGSRDDLELKDTKKQDVLRFTCCCCCGGL
jgi:hypothetical protein